MRRCSLSLKRITYTVEDLSDFGSFIDHSYYQQDRRRVLNSMLKESRKNNKQAYLVVDKLYTDNTKIYYILYCYISITSCVLTN